MAAQIYWLLGMDAIHSGKERQLGNCNVGDVGYLLNGLCYIACTYVHIK